MFIQIAFYVEGCLAKVSEFLFHSCLRHITEIIFLSKKLPVVTLIDFNLLCFN